mmetsp:Transcript_88417/g.254983  ORF Transcript_88417/g.254983 Transcript_88417/m.254983 type:complete len:315 (-) Transcript_88417:85-1029(-)
MHEARGVALQHRRPEEREVPGLRGRAGDGLRLGVPGLGHGLARERGVVHLHAVCAIQDTDIGWHAVPGLEEDHIARDEVNGVDAEGEALAVGAAAHRRHRLVATHFLHGLHGVLREHLRVPLQRRRGHDDDREEDRRDNVVVFLLHGLLLRAVEAEHAWHQLRLALDLLDRVIEEYEEPDHGDDAEPQQDVEDATEGHAKQFDPLVFLLRGGDAIRAIHVKISARLLLLQTRLALLARPVRGELRLEDRGELAGVERMHQSLVVLVLLRRILRSQLAVPLPDLLRLNDDGAARAQHALGGPIRHRVEGPRRHRP